MRSHIAATWAFAVTLAFVSIFTLAEANAQTLGPSPSLRVLAAELSSPEALTRYIWKNFLFEKDRRQFGREDHWQRPEELLVSRKGDCEDFALFAQAILKAQGIQAFLLNVYGEGTGHTVTVYREDEHYVVLDGTSVSRIDAESVEELSEKINPHWQASALVTPSKMTGSAIVLKTFEKKLRAHHAVLSAV